MKKKSRICPFFVEDLLGILSGYKCANGAKLGAKERSTAKEENGINKASKSCFFTHLIGCT